ncbi:MAG: thermonuclease family protein [Candidatus Dojkabacteria bacterium]|nr:thermonuclease family protein [Candidatus Dojkabacteria bacterium]
MRPLKDMVNRLTALYSNLSARSKTLLLGLVIPVTMMCGIYASVWLISRDPSPEESVVTQQPTGSALGEEDVQTEESPVETRTVAQVISITDGDTIRIMYEGESTPVRLIGIDTPETESSPDPVECFGEEAKRKMEELLSGQEVFYEFDETQGEQDKYGRLLLYLWRTSDDLFINEHMVKEGYAHEYTYNTPYRYQSQFQRAENIASSESRGLWGDVCGCVKDAEKGRTCVACNTAQVTYTNWDCSEYMKEVEDVSCTSGCAAAQPAPVTTPAPEQICCKYCTTGQACGDSCISKSYTCHKPPGCACNAY